MKDRCYNKNRKKYKNYGGRGITVCEEWKTDFLAFVKWSDENGYGDDLTLDRKKNNGNYCPDNCKWSTYEEQNQNKTNSKVWTIDDKEFGSTYEAAKFHGVSYQTIVQWCEGYTQHRTKKIYPPKPGCSSRLKYED